MAGSLVIRESNYSRFAGQYSWHPPSGSVQEEKKEQTSEEWPVQIARTCAVQVM
jgi:hypothetical protein